MFQVGRADAGLRQQEIARKMVLLHGDNLAGPCYRTGQIDRGWSELRKGGDQALRDGVRSQRHDHVGFSLH